MFVQTMRLDYGGHEEEIATISNVLHEIQTCQPYPEALHPLVVRLLARLDLLMTIDKARTRIYDPSEERIQ